MRDSDSKIRMQTSSAVGTALAGLSACLFQRPTKINCVCGIDKFEGLLLLPCHDRVRSGEFSKVKLLAVNLDVIAP